MEPGYLVRKRCLIGRRCEGSVAGGGRLGERIRQGEFRRGVGR